MPDIIYTEDNPSVSRVVLPIIQTVAAENGHTVVHFTQGAEAIRAIEDETRIVVALITDLSLEDRVSGLTIASSAAKRGIKKVFVFSTAAEEDASLNYMQALADRYGIQFELKNKPAEPGIITDIVANLLQG